MKNRIRAATPEFNSILGEQKTMSSYDNTNTGAVWPNRNKQAETHADFSGSINIEGVEYFIDAWRKPADAADKAPVLKFKVKRKEKQS
jgi:hypothetical protein